jgi:hypothetical protein
MLQSSQLMIIGQLQISYLKHKYQSSCDLFMITWYDKEKYREMILDAAGTVLSYFGFDRTVYGTPGKNEKKMKRYDQLQDERTKDIQA